MSLWLMGRDSVRLGLRRSVTRFIPLLTPLCAWRARVCAAGSGARFAGVAWAGWGDLLGVAEDARVTRMGPWERPPVVG